QRTLIVQQVMPPSCRHEFREHDCDYFVWIKGQSPIDIASQRTDQRAIRRSNYYQLNAFDPAAPLLAQLLRGFVVNVDVDGGDVSARDRLCVFQRLQYAAMYAGNRHNNFVLDWSNFL